MWERNRKKAISRKYSKWVYPFVRKTIQLKVTHVQLSLFRGRSLLHSPLIHLCYEVSTSKVTNKPHANTHTDRHAILLLTTISQINLGQLIAPLILSLQSTLSWAASHCQIVVWTVPCPFTKPPSQVVLKQKFLQAGYPPCWPFNSVKVSNYTLCIIRHPIICKNTLPLFTVCAQLSLTSVNKLQTLTAKNYRPSASLRPCSPPGGGIAASISSKEHTITYRMSQELQHNKVVLTFNKQFRVRGNIVINDITTLCIQYITAKYTHSELCRMWPEKQQMQMQMSQHLPAINVRVPKLPVIWESYFTQNLTVNGNQLCFCSC